MKLINQDDKLSNIDLIHFIILLNKEKSGKLKFKLKKYKYSLKDKLKLYI